MDFLNPLRLRAIFGGHYPMDEKPPVDIMGQPSARDIFAPVNQDTENTQQPIQPMQDEAMKRFMMSLNEMPTREQGNSSNWRKVGAGIVGGFNGMDKGNEFLNRPYTEKIDDWKLKSGTLGRAAELERLTNANISQDEHRDMMTSINAGKLAQNTADDAEKNRLAQERLTANSEIAKRKSDLQQEALRGGTIIVDEKGNVYLNRKNGLVEKIPDLDMFSDAEKQEMINSGRLKVVATQGANAQKLESQRSANDMAQIKERGEQVRKNTSVRKSGALQTDKAMTVAADNAAWNLARKQFIMDNPSKAGYWDSASGSPTSEAEDSDDYPDAVEDIRVRYNKIKDRSGANPDQINTSALPSNTPVKRTGTARVRRTSDGQTGTWDFSKGPIPSGFEEVK